MSTDKQTIDIYNVQLLRLSNKVWFGVGAIQKIHDICQEMKERKIHKCMVITGKASYKNCWDVVSKALKENEIEYKHFDKVTPNPLEEQVAEASKIALEFGAEFFIAIGGGSTIDCCKAIATQVKSPSLPLLDLYTTKEKFGDAKYIQMLPVIAINTTHGTGTEADRYSVCSFPKELLKLGTGHENMYPMYSIDDPALMTNLPLNQTLYTSLDAVNHANECATSKFKSCYSILLARETIALVTKYLPIAIKDPKNLEARYYLTYAALIAGTGIDNGLCHITHNMEHVLSVIVPDFPHGLGLSILLPAVEEECYPHVWKIFVDIWSPILPKDKVWGINLKEEAKEFAKIVENWIFSLGVTEKLSNFGFEDKLDQLTQLGFETRPQDSPLDETEEEIRRIYKKSMHPLK